MKHPKRLLFSIERRLSGYALAAGAAGVGMLSLAQSAKAKIIYTPVQHVIEPGHSYKLDLANNGTADFTLNNYLLKGCTTSGGWCYRFGQKPGTGNSVVGFTSIVWPCDSALRAGSRIGPGARFFPPAAYLASVLSGFGRFYHCPWQNVSNRYLGLKFKIKKKTHYGWARLSVRVMGTHIVGTLTGYAYETIPNKPIITGKTKGPDVIAAKSGSLGRLAQGSAGRLGN